MALACAAFTTPHTAAHGSMFDAVTHLYTLLRSADADKTVARLVMLVFAHTRTHTRASVETCTACMNWFRRIAANDSIVHNVSVCVKRRDQLTKAGGARVGIEPTTGKT